MDYRSIAEYIESFIREEVKRFNGGVIGLSGGIDSTVVAYLAVHSLGKERVHGLIMPYRENQNTVDATETAETLGMPYDVISIRPIAESFHVTGHFNNQASSENLLPRIRMCLLYSVSNGKGMVVLGTSNRSEIETGYFTKYGDGGVDIEPIGDLYKTEVWELAKFLGVPQKIIGKTPSADLLPGQTDEGDIGMSYHTLDRILKGDIEGISAHYIERVEELRDASWHKRRMPRLPRIKRVG